MFSRTSELRHQQHPPGLFRVPAILFLIGTSLLLNTSSTVAQYQTIGITSNFTVMTAAMMDDDDVALAGFDYSNRSVYARNVINRTAEQPQLLRTIPQGDSWSPPKMITSTRGLYLAFGQRNTLLVFKRNASTWEADIGLSGNPSLNMTSPALCSSPDGIIYAAGTQTGCFFWSRCVNDSISWEQLREVNWSGIGSIQMELSPVGGELQPRVYTYLSSRRIAYRQHEGSSWSEPVILPFTVPLEDRWKVVRRSDGRHFLAFLEYPFLVHTYDEQPDGQFVFAGTRVADMGCWESGTGAPEHFDLAADRHGAVHLFRPQDAWRYENHDIWFCAQAMYWEQHTGTEWFTAPWTMFDGQHFDAITDHQPAFILCPQLEVGPPGFLWVADFYDDTVVLMVCDAQTAGSPEPDASFHPTPAAAGTRRVASAWPNPTRRGTTVTWPSSPAAPPRLSAFDAGGRFVRELAPWGVGKDAWVTEWDGADDLGRPVAPGLYLLRSRDRGGPVVKVIVTR